MVVGIPVKEAILNNIQGIDTTGAYAATGLGLLVAAAPFDPDEYYTEVSKITRIEASPLELSVFPAIVLAPINTDFDPEGTQGTTTIAAKYRLQLTLLLRTRDEAVQKIERFVRDAHKAILVDLTCGGNAIWTRAVSDEVFYPTDDDEPYTIANVLLEILYRTPRTDLNLPT